MPLPTQITQHIRTTAPSLLHNLQNSLSKLPVELVWAAHAQWPLPPDSGPRGPLERLKAGRRPIRISVLDSSFNPPTLAHLALANSARPKYSNEAPKSNGDHGEYDAKLLLLSVKNADKTLKPGDASYVQRLEMMGLLARDVYTRPGNGEGDGEGGMESVQDRLTSEHNVAIAIVDEPTFVGKSKVLREYLRRRLESLSNDTQQISHDVERIASTPDRVPIQPQLTFIVGLDTLERLFSPRYYTPTSPPPSHNGPGPETNLTAEQNMVSVLTRMLSPAPEGDDSLLVCARRTVSLPSDASTTPTPSGVDLGVKLGWLKDPSSPHGAPVSRGSPSPRGSLGDSPSTMDTVPKDERIVLIDIGDRASKFSSTAVRNARARVGHMGTENAGGGLWRQWVTGSVAEYVETERLYIS